METTYSSASRADKPADGILEHLMLSVGDGNRKAFAELYDLTSIRVLGLTRRVLCNPSDAEEVTQDVFLEIWRRAVRFDPSRGSALNWILMIAHSRAVDKVRSSQASRHRDHCYAQQTTHSEAGTDLNYITRASNVEQLRTALPGLTSVRREALTLAFFSDQSYREASATLKIPVPTFKSRVRDGLIALKIALT